MHYIVPGILIQEQAIGHWRISDELISTKDNNPAFSERLLLVTKCSVSSQSPK